MEEKNAKLVEENAKLAHQMQVIEKQIEKMIEQEEKNQKSLGYNLYYKMINLHLSSI